MHQLFAEYIGRGVFIYLDYILLYFANFDDFVNVLTSVLSILKQHGFKCRGGKYEIGVPEVQCLGHVLSEAGVCMSNSRIEAVTAMPFPRSAKELRLCLGSVNYMRGHIVNLSVLTKPLSSRVNEPIASWPREEMQVAFELVQEAVRTQINLAHLNYEQTIVVTTDASVLGVGGCVSNRYRNESGEVVNRIVTVASHAEGRMKTIEQEAFGVVCMGGHPFVL